MVFGAMIVTVPGATMGVAAAVRSTIVTMGALPVRIPMTVVVSVIVTPGGPPVFVLRLTQNPAALVSALERIEGRSAIPGLGAGQDAMMIDGAHQGPLATHPTIADRIAAIVAVTGSMALIAPARRDTRDAAQGLSSKAAPRARHPSESYPPVRRRSFRKTPNYRHRTTPTLRLVRTPADRRSSEVCASTRAQRPAPEALGQVRK
jgi:hypothetical protein